MFGFPDAILSDQGRQFESSVYIDFLNQFKIKKLCTNANHASSNGIVERFNGIIKKRMLSYLTQKGISMNCWQEPHLMAQLVVDLLMFFLGSS